MSTKRKSPARKKVARRSRSVTKSPRKASRSRASRTTAVSQADGAVNARHNEGREGDRTNG